MKHKLILLLALVLVVSALGVTTAFAREIGGFYFELTNSNESDTTGVWHKPGGSTLYLEKETTDRVCAISNNVYSGGSYNYKSALFWSPNNNYRSTNYAWLSSGERETESFIGDYGDSGETHCIWARRDDRETVTYTFAYGTWSPDES